RRGGVTVAPEPGDVVVDAGAYLGETAIRFALDAGPEGRVLAFDPSPAHARLARENVRRNGLKDRVRVLAAGLADASSIAGLDDADPSDAAPAQADAGRRMRADDPQVTLDDLCRWADIARVDYVKMDIEGCEIAALAGSRETILAHRPKLGVCVYHRPTDLW